LSFKRISVIFVVHGKTPVVGTNGVSFTNLPIEQEKIMIKFGLIGAAALSLALTLVAPAMADDMQSTGVQGHKRHVRTAPPRTIVNNLGEPNLPIENALRWGYSQGYAYYPSGFGGLYGDGRYPGNTISNPGHPYLHP
jgi:hypothetical protein